jgi:hypothetical protein
VACVDLSNLVNDKFKQLRCILFQLNAWVDLFPLWVKVDAKLKYFVTNLSNNYYLNKDVINHIKYWEYFSHSGHILFHLIDKNVEVIAYKTVILPMVLYGCEIVSFTKKLKVFKNRLQVGLFRLKGRT